MNRRTFLATGTAALAAATYPLIGCDQTTISQFVNLIAQDAASLATYFGQTGLAGQITSIASQIAVDITNWQSGAAATDAIQAINDLIGLVNQIPIAAPYAPLIVLILSALTGLLALLPQSSASPATAKVVSERHVSPMPIGGVDKTHVTQAQKNFQGQWKLLLAQTPGLKTAS